MAIPVFRGLASALGDTFGELLDRVRADGDDQPGGEVASGAEGPEATPQALAMRLELLRREVQQSLGKFGRLAAEKLREAGIDLSQPMELRSDGRDGVYESGLHRQRAEIEQVFEQHPELTHAFYDAAAKIQQLQAAGREEADGELQLRLLGEDVIPTWR